ncbi:MAG: nucleotidyltransferase domain-containing protein [Planctomycetes bacterium]|nr:nucleotidyltransferase domain-containing protein [Planctomycetota bacterium]
MRQPGLSRRETALAARVRPIFACHPSIAVAYTFGSRARGEARPDSDLDVGVVFRRPRPDRERRFWETLELAGELGPIVEAPAIDVVDLEAQGPIFCHRALVDGKILYEGDPDRRVDFESDACALALDFELVQEIGAKEYPRAFRRWLARRAGKGTR